MGSKQKRIIKRREKIQKTDPMIQKDFLQEFNLNSMGVAMKLANMTVGAWHDDLSTAIAIPHRNTVTPIKGNDEIFSEK